MFNELAFDSQGYVEQVLRDYEQVTITSYDSEIIRDWIGWKNDYPRYDQEFQPVRNERKSRLAISSIRSERTTGKGFL